MNIGKILTDEGAVSPVIGVILMVAITVILAAVIGTFVLGIGDQQQTTPQVSFDFEYNSTGTGNLTITHVGGDELTKENTAEITVNTSKSGCSTPWGTPIAAGDTKTLNCDLAGETVRIIWQSPRGSQTQQLAKFEVSA